MGPKKLIFLIKIIKEAAEWSTQFLIKMGITKSNPNQRYFVRGQMSHTQSQEIVGSKTVTR